MIKICVPTEADIEACVEIGKVFHAATRYAKYKYSTTHVYGLLRSFVDNPEYGIVLVAKDGDTVVGGIIACIAKFYFNDQKFAEESGLFVMPTARGGTIGLKLLKALIDECRSRGDIMELVVGNSTAVDVKRTAALYKRAGFVKIGDCYSQVL